MGSPGRPPGLSHSSWALPGSLSENAPVLIISCAVGSRYDISMLQGNSTRNSRSLCRGGFGKCVELINFPHTQDRNMARSLLALFLKSH